MEVEQKSVSILLVEDDKPQVKLISLAFERRGNGEILRIAHSLAEARQSIDQNKPDLVIADLGLPDGQGLELLKKDADFPDYPVLFMTARDDTQIAVEAMKKGALDYVFKTAESLSQMPRIAQRALREWRLMLEHRQAEQALRDSERRLKTVVENMPVMMAAIDTEGRFLVWNKECQRVTGYAAEEIVGNPNAFEQLFPDVEHRHSALIEITNNGYDFRDWEWKTTCKDGSSKTIAWHNISGEFPIAGWDAWGIGVDVTARKRAEEERTRFFSLAIDFLMILDFAGNIKRVNPAWEQKLGFAPEEIIDRSLLEIVHPEDRDEVKNQLQQVAAGGESAKRFVCRCCCNDGTYLWLNWSVVPHVAEELIYGLGHDITEQTQAETRLRTSLAEKELLLKEVYHRVKNNLQLVSSMLSLQAGSIDGKSVEEILEDCQSRVMAMSLVHQRLYQSQDLSQIDLAELSSTLANDLFQASGLNSRQVSLALNTQEVILTIDKAIPCGLILNELLSNAFKYAFPGGQIGNVTVELRPADNRQVYMAVTDDGAGFPDDFDIEKVKSLGMRLVKALSRQLHAELILSHGDRNGFSLQFKL